MVDPTDPARPLAYKTNDGLWHLRVSALGSCVPRFALHGLGIADPTPPDKKSQYYFDSGNWFEAEYKKAFRVNMINDTETFTLRAGPKAIISGNTDGLMKLPSEGLVNLECKFMGNSTFGKFQRKGILSNMQYAYQVSAALYAYPGRPVLFVVGNRPPDWDEAYPFDDLTIKQVLITKPPVPLGKLLTRANSIVRFIEAASRDGEVDRDKIATALKETHGSTCSGNEYLCDIDWFHREQKKTLAERAVDLKASTGNVIGAASPSDGNEQAALFEVEEDQETLVSMVAEYVAHRDKETAAKKARGEAGERIKKHMQEIKLEDFDAGSFVVTCKLKPGNKRFDKAQLALDMGEEFVQKYTKPGPEDVKLDIREKRKKN